jgi:pseudaminic acid synthase
MVTISPFQSLDPQACKMVLDWRNSDYVRKWMKSQNKIDETDHQRFVENLRSDRDRYYFLVREDGRDIGTINITRRDRGIAEGGLLKNPDIEIPAGNILISALEREMIKHGFHEIVLEVHEDNERAINLYRRLGYLLQGMREGYLVFRKAIEDVCLIIGELSANHAHDIENAKKSIIALAEAGADAVKIQTYTANTITIDCDNEYFTINQGTLWDGRTLYNLYQEAYTPWEWYNELRDLAESLGLIFFSTPFDKTAVDFLEEKNVPWYKIASFEITDIPLIEYTASKKKPIIISTGIADAGDIQLAVDTCRRAGNNDITLLQCTSSYPAPVERSNLRMIPNLAETFGVKSGLSDHTIGSAAAVAAVALGATMIEKHFILDRSIGGPDAAFSMEPEEFRKMVEEIRIVEKALGGIDYSLTEAKKNSRKFSRSLFVVEDIPAGGVITEGNVSSIRPGDGMHPKYFSEVLGKKAAMDLKRGEPLNFQKIR